MHGDCTVSYQALEMTVKAQCLCDPGYAVAAGDPDKLRTCEYLPLKSSDVPVWLVYILAIGIPLICIGICAAIIILM